MRRGKGEWEKTRIKKKEEEEEDRRCEDDGQAGEEKEQRGKQRENSEWDVRRITQVCIELRLYCAVRCLWFLKKKKNMVV